MYESRFWGWRMPLRCNILVSPQRITVSNSSKGYSAKFVSVYFTEFGANPSRFNNWQFSWLLWTPIVFTERVTVHGFGCEYITFDQSPVVTSFAISAIMLFSLLLKNVRSYTLIYVCRYACYVCIYVYSHLTNAFKNKETL